MAKDGLGYVVSRYRRRRREDCNWNVSSCRTKPRLCFSCGCSRGVVVVDGLGLMELVDNFALVCLSDRAVVELVLLCISAFRFFLGCEPSVALCHLEGLSFLLLFTFAS